MLSDILFNLAKQLHPTGRAFRITKGSEKEKLELSLSSSEANAVSDAYAILDAILADNDNFTEDDATDWERRLGMISNSAVDLELRKAAIRRKYAAPGIQPAHAHYLYLQRQLQMAGFDVWVYENRFPTYPDGYETESPFDFTYGDTSILGAVQHGMTAGNITQHGDVQHGSYYNNKIVNYIEREKDAVFSLGGSYRATFFVGGPTPGSFADVPAEREKEFRQLILQVKQVQSVGFLLIHYI